MHPNFVFAPIKYDLAVCLLAKTKLLQFELCFCFAKTQFREAVTSFGAQTVHLNRVQVARFVQAPASLMCTPEHLNIWTSEQSSDKEGSDKKSSGSPSFARGTPAPLMQAPTPFLHTSKQEQEEGKGCKGMGLCTHKLCTWTGFRLHRLCTHKQVFPSEKPSSGASKTKFKLAAERRFRRPRTLFRCKQRAKSKSVARFI